MTLQNTKNQQIITLRHLHELAYGASFMASGGGGDPYVGRLILQQELTARHQLTLIDPADVDDDASILGVGAVGAPSVIIERLPNIDGFVRALDQVRRRLSRKIDAIIPVEAGGINATIPLAVAVRVGVPVIDADGMGRAFPETQMTTFSIFGFSAAPIYLVDDFREGAAIEAEDNVKADRLMRSAIVAMGGAAMAVAFPLTGAELKRAAVRNTITFQLGVGRAVLAARDANRDPVEALLQHFRDDADHPRFAVSLFEGRITDLKRRVEGAFTLGNVRITNPKNTKDVCDIRFKNENLIVTVGESVQAVVPDIITIVDADSADPITTENLQFGQRVRVIAVAAPDILRTPEALAVVGPRAFKLDFDYRPLEAIHSGKGRRT